ncbi:MAG: DUF4136 domain-containing protein [Steroidobacteraceae bacterium]
MRKFIIPLALALFAACATGPRVRVDRDPSANFAAYRTYNFAPELGTDRAGYSTIITGHFKRAVSREMEARGYTLSESPNLLVNFFTSVRDRTSVQNTPVIVGVDYYRYRNGLYVAWPLYHDDVTTTQYQVGTASVDVVEAARKQLVWEGMAEGRLSRRAQKDPGLAIDNAVKEIFERYPARAGSASP